MVVSRKPFLRKGIHSDAGLRIVGDRYFVAAWSHARGLLCIISFNLREPS